MSRRQPLSRRRILQTALELVDREGLEALSMRRLGAELGVEAMSLYNHVSDKQALLDGIAELLLEEVVIPAPDPQHWEDAWREVGCSYRRMGHRHPRAFPLVALRWSRTDGVLRRTVEALQILLAAGLPTTTALKAFAASESFTRGFVLEELGLSVERAKHEAQGRFVPEEPEADPAIDALRRYALDRDTNAEFEFGVELLLAGLREMIARTTAEG